MNKKPEQSMRHAIATFSAAALLAASTSFAAAAPELPAGKPAGIQQAQSDSSHVVLIGVGVGLAALGIALAASGGNGGGPNTSTNTVTGTAP